MADIDLERNDRRLEAAEIVAAFDGVTMDFSGSDRAWRYGGGRDLSHLEADASADMAD
jgi:hypothetical protein